MTVWVIRNGKLVEKRKALLNDAINAASRSLRDDMWPPRGLAAPYVSRMEPFESPVTGAEITSWRQRDADMRAAGAYDPRDLPRDHVYAKGRKIQLKEAKNGRSEP